MQKKQTIELLKYCKDDIKELLVRVMTVQPNENYYSEDP